VFFQFVMKGLAERRDIRLGGTGVGYVGNPMGRSHSTDEQHPPSCAFHQSWGKVANQFHMGHDVNGNLVTQILQRLIKNSPAFTAPAFDTMRPISRSRVASLILSIEPSSLRST